MAQMKYFYELTISSSPHAHSPVTTQTIMRDVLIALVPALLGSIYFFGFRALLVTLVSAAACVFFEWGFCKVRKLHCKTYDLSAVVTGVLLAFVCPVTIPYWTIILGDFFAIVLVKMLFGGLGKNIVNPALAGRAFLFSWPVLMSNWVKVGFDNAAGLLSTADAVTGSIVRNIAATSRILHNRFFKYLPPFSKPCALSQIYSRPFGCIADLHCAIS